MSHSKGRPAGAAPSPEIINREQQVLALRREGYTWNQISHQVGYRSPSGSRDAYMRAMQRVLVEDVENLRALEYDRLEHLHQAHWEKAINGDIRSTEIILKIMERRSKLLALDLKHPRQKVQEVTCYGYEPTEVQRLVRWYGHLSEQNPMPKDF
jgi:hypothetical protein